MTDPRRIVAAKERSHLLRRGEALAHLGSWKIDLVSGRATWSAEVYRIFGVERATFRPTSDAVLQRVHPDDRDRVRDALREAISAGRGFALTHRVVRPDGAVRFVEVGAEVGHDAAGRAVEFVGFVHDVTRQQQRAAALEARLRLRLRNEQEPLEHLLRATLDEAELLTHSTIGFYHFVTPDQQHLSLQTWSSHTLAHMCTAEGAGKHYPVAEAGIWADCVRERRAIVHNDYANAPHRRGLPKGHAVVTRELVVPVLRGGLVRAVLGVGNKQVEYDDADVEAVSLLADLAWDLAEHAREAETSRALERRLLQAQKLESLGVLAAGVSHAYNNLLQQIVGNLELAALQPLPDGAADQVDRAMRAARRADELTQQMLAYAGSTPVARERIELDAFLQKHADLHRALVPPTQRLHLECRAGGAAIDVDPAQLQQIAVHLLRNAGEALAGRRGTITLRTGLGEESAASLAASPVEPRPEPGRFVRLEVDDDGAGMDEATLQRIFDPFFTTKLAGRGLGLPTVFGIVRSHGGAIVVRSRPGEGTTVTVLFRAAASQAVAPPPGRRVPNSPGRGAVLVVDDDPSVRSVCESFLRHLGFLPVSASDGDEAVRRFAAEPLAFRAVVTDLMMPGRDGLATCAAIKALRPGVPVVLSSGFQQSGAEGDGDGAKPDAFLRKPYRMADLRQVLATVLGETAPAGAAGEAAEA